MPLKIPTSGQLPVKSSGFFQKNKYSCRIVLIGQVPFLLPFSRFFDSFEMDSESISIFGSLSKPVDLKIHFCSTRHFSLLKSEGFTFHSLFHNFPQFLIENALFQRKSEKDAEFGSQSVPRSSSKLEVKRLCYNLSHAYYQNLVTFCYKLLLKTNIQT